MSEYIVAVFKVIVGLVTSERLAICACIIYGGLLLWILLSLLFSFQSKFSRNCKKISVFVDENGLTSETYPKFIGLATKLPDSFIRGWKTFEHSNNGLPSEYIKRAECLDLELSGGLFNQNRSVMKGYIGFFTAFLTLVCLALCGNKDVVTGYLLAEALILPFTFFVICMLTYFLYAALRQHQYKMCVEDFNEMIDILNEKVECSELEWDSRNVRSSKFIEEVVDPAVESLKPIVVVEEKELNVDDQVDNDTELKSVSDVELEIKSLVNQYNNKQNRANGIEINKLEEYNADTQEETDDMDNQIVEQKRGRGRPRKEKMPEGELVIKNDKEFEEVLARAEKLMKKNEEPLSQSQQKRVEKALKELVDAMKKYKEEN